MKVKVGVSNTHAHLTQDQIEKLFGKGFSLTFFRNIRQNDEFVSNQTIDVEGPKGTLKNVRILGPAKDQAQVEVSLTNARKLGVDTEVRLSTKVEDTPGAKLIGPEGETVMEQGIIVAARHLHISPEEAAAMNLKEGQTVCAEATGARGLTFRNIVVRIDELYAAELHLDTDEANAAGLKHGDEVALIL
ncbi:MAG TPA: phosphate propanoyltransferase [Anaerovoracaceae bacterium]|nr:phosphate propanoyltransferase [Anaerovoracaceae bacterium]